MTEILLTVTGALTYVQHSHAAKLKFTSNFLSICQKIPWAILLPPGWVVLTFMLSLRVWTSDFTSAR